MNTKFKFKVEEVESEAGWGQSCLRIEEFDTYEQAIEFIDKVNSKNTAGVVPVYYTFARPVNFNIYE